MFILAMIVCAAAAYRLGLAIPMPPRFIATRTTTRATPTSTTGANHDDPTQPPPP